MNAEIDRELRQREADEAAALSHLEPEHPSRRDMAPGVDHSAHECNNDPTDPWSECTTDRPF